MSRIFLPGPSLALLLAACVQTSPEDQGRRDYADAVVSRYSDTPPEGPADACWANDEIPAVIETVTEQVLVAPEQRDETGAVTQAAVFDTKVDQRMVQDREVVWFQTPCPAVLDAAFLATLQRALKARGYFLQGVTGAMDDATRDAIRRFQAERGLDSDILSVAAARELGLIEVPRDKL
jgi:Putative peptidoglycan binding domain